MTAKKYLESTYVAADYNVRPRAICEDGFSVSIQGGSTGPYCSPRELCNCYVSVELGFPSEADDIIAPFAETPNTTETVFPYISIALVEELIAKHGGIVEPTAK